MTERLLPEQLNEQNLNLGRLTRSLAYSFHSDYSNLLLSFRSMAGSREDASTDDYNRKKNLLAWAKEKTALLNEFRSILRVPYDINLYAVINTVQEKMFKRRQQVISVVDQLRDLTNLLDQLKLPIYAVEEALIIIKDGKKNVDYFKLDYLLRAKVNSIDYEELEKLAKGKDTQEMQEEEKTFSGIFEKIGFCIDKYFYTHYYLGDKVVCQIGDLAEVTMIYHKKEVVKFGITKIKLLKSLEVFSMSEDVWSGMNRLQMELNKLVYKINEKIKKEFYVTVDDVINQDFPDEIRDFETYEEHEQEHRQLAKILQYIKKCLKTLIIQVIYYKFNQKKLHDQKFNRKQEINKMNFSFEKMEIGIVSGKIYL